MADVKKPARASVPKSALARLYFIDTEIASGKFPNTGYLAKKWEGISVSTISRDVEFMRVRLNAPIEYDAARRGYYYSEPQYRIPTGFSGADELLALGMAKNILTIYRDTPVYDAARHLLESITAPLSAENGSDWYESRIVVPQLPSAPIPDGVWNSLTAALRENRVLVFEYMGSYDEEYLSRRVRPYQLLFDTGIWYLYGYSEERGGIRLFSLCRVKNVTLTKDRFTLPKDFDYRAGSAGFFGVFTGQKKQRFKIAFYDYSVSWVRDRKWAEDQKITETEDGVIVTFTSTQFGKVLEWLLSRGCTARPLEPGQLVEAWLAHVEEMRKMAVKK